MKINGDDICEVMDSQTAVRVQFANWEKNVNCLFAQLILKLNKSVLKKLSLIKDVFNQAQRL